ncbi:hypothetical protein O9992_14610 [Vibrio lentus]|nr:hypothetical protein [Vibrio lentus]
MGILISTIHRYGSLRGGDRCICRSYVLRRCDSWPVGGVMLMIAIYIAARIKIPAQPFVGWGESVRSCQGCELKLRC